MIGDPEMYKPSKEKLFLEKLKIRKFGQGSRLLLFSMLPSFLSLSRREVCKTSTRFSK